jgi:hypothetical protein
MSRAAHALLDRAREGAQLTEAEITAALIETGDISEPNHFAHVLRKPGTWQPLNRARATWLDPVH